MADAPAHRKPLALIGLDWTVTDFGALCRHQKTPKVNLPYGSAIGPHILQVFSTPITADGHGEWKARNLGGLKRRVWRRLHVGIDGKTLGVRALEVTTGNVGDAAVLRELLD